MRPVSDDFKAVWAQKQGQRDRVRVRYKRRYWTGAAFAYEASYQILTESDFIGVGRIPSQVDSQFQNVFKSSTITLMVDNARNEWIESTVPPSVFAIDAVATSGYELHRSIFHVQFAYDLPDGSTEWTSIFTGYALRQRITGHGAVAEVEVTSSALFLEKSDATEVSDTFTLEDAIPATGDGVNKEFTTTSIGVDHLNDVQVNAISQNQGSAWTVSNLNKVSDAASNGKALVKFATAPGAGQTVKVSGVKWKQNKKIEELVDMLAVNAGITDKQIDPVLFPGVSASVTIDSQAQFEAGIRTNVSTVNIPGKITRKWFLIDDFTDGDFTASPVWGVLTQTNTTISVVGGKLRIDASGPAVSFMQMTTPFTKAYGTFDFGAKWVRPAPGVSATSTEFQFIKVSNTIHGNGYSLEFNAATGETRLLKKYNNDNSFDVLLVLETVVVPDATEHTWRITRTTGNEFKVYKDGILLGTVTDGDFTTNAYFGYSILRAAVEGTLLTELDNIYWSPEVDAVGATSNATAVFESAEQDLLATPTAFGLLAVLQTLNGGSVAYATAVASISGGPYDAYVAVAINSQIQSALKRYLKIRATITPFVLETPEVDKLVANYTSQTVVVALANFAGKDGFSAVETLANLAEYEFLFDGDGKLIFRSKNIATDPAVEINQENAIIDVLEYDPGHDRVRNAADVRYGSYVDRYDGADAGEPSPTSEQRYGRVIISQDIGQFLLANDADLGSQRAQLLYENNFQAKLRLRVKSWFIPWLEVADKARVSYYDNPILEESVASDPLQVMEDGYMAGGEAQNVIARNLDMKVLEYSPDPTERTAEILLEEILA